MGCSTLDVGEIEGDTEIRDWALADPDDVRAIRDEIDGKVAALFDELDA